MEVNYFVGDFSLGGGGTRPENRYIPEPIRSFTVKENPI